MANITKLIWGGGLGIWPNFRIYLSNCRNLWVLWCPSETYTQRRDGSYSLERKSLRGRISKSAQKNWVIGGHRTASILSTRDSQGMLSSNAEIMEIMSSSVCMMFKHRTFHTITASQAEISSSWELTTASRFLRITPACSNNLGKYQWYRRLLSKHNECAWNLWTIDDDRAPIHAF